MSVDRPTRLSVLSPGVYLFANPTAKVRKSSSALRARSRKVTSTDNPGATMARIYASEHLSAVRALRDELGAAPTAK